MYVMFTIINIYFLMKKLNESEIKKIDGIVKFDQPRKACKVISDVIYLLKGNLWIEYFKKIYSENKINVNCIIKLNT